MKLWTWQQPKRDIRREGSSEDFGEAAWGEATWGKPTWSRLLPLYEQLREITGLSQFIWCSLRYENWMSDQVRKLWELNVPDDHVPFVVDDVAWTTLLSGTLTKMSEKEAWATLLEPGASLETTSVLVEIPLDDNWVIECTRFNRCDKQNAPYDELPCSLEDAVANRSPRVT